MSTEPYVLNISAGVDLGRNYWYPYMYASHAFPFHTHPILWLWFQF
jgi:hypothetical protein